MEGRDLPLYAMMSYHLGWVDEHGEPFSSGFGSDRTRGALCVLAAQAVGEPSVATLRYATAVELLHNYAQIHADIQEGNPDRNNRPALWWVWGPAQGINAGDGMHALARLAIFSLSDEDIPPEEITVALKRLDSAALAQCEGNYSETTFQEQLRIRVDDYLQMVSDLSGRLLGTTAWLGARSAAERDEARLDALTRFGESLGAAMHLSQDYAAFWPKSDQRDQNTQGRLVAKKKTLPVVHAIATAEPRVRREIGTVYAQRVIDPANIEEITPKLEACGSREFTRDKIAETLQEARAALDAARLSGEHRASIEALVTSVTSDLIG